MNVLWLVHYPVYGGPHGRIVRSFPYLRRAGVSVTAVLPDEVSNAPERLRSSGIPVIQLPLRRMRTARCVRANTHYVLGIPDEIRRLRGLIRRIRSEVLIVGGLVNPQGPLAARLEGIGVVWQVVDSRIPKPLAAAFMPIVDRTADVVMFGGHALLAAHPGAEGLSPTVIVRPPSVETKDFRPSESVGRATRDALRIPRSAPVVGMVANVNPQKGIEYFARASILIHQAVPDAYFLLVGARHRTHARYDALVRDIVANSELPAGRFIFAGATNEPERWYPAMTVKLITSVPRSEGTTTTALEALACGVPVVATRVGAVEEVVREGTTGLMVEPCNAAAMADATVRLLKDRMLAESLGRAGRSMVKSEFSAASGAADDRRAFELAVEASRRRGTKHRRWPMRL